jgi:hypothetical protein
LLFLLGRVGAERKKASVAMPRPLFSEKDIQQTAAQRPPFHGARQNRTIEHNLKTGDSTRCFGAFPNKTHDSSMTLI